MKNGYKGLGVTKKTTEGTTTEEILTIVRNENLKELLSKNQILSATVENIKGTHQYKIIIYKYVFDGVLYSEKIELTVTLKNGEPDFDRWDVFVLNSDHTITVNEGTVTENVLKPDLLENQIEITSVIVRQNSTENTDIQTITIYNENTGIAGGEFDTSTRHDLPEELANFNYAEDFSTGAKSLFCNNIRAANYIHFDSNVDYLLKDITAFIVDVKLITTSDDTNFRLGFLLEDSLLRSSTHTHFWIDHSNDYGLDYTLLNEWQTINIPVNSLYNYDAEIFNQLVAGHNHFGKSFLLDNIRFQTGGVKIEAPLLVQKTKLSEFINDLPIKTKLSEFINDVPFIRLSNLLDGGFNKMNYIGYEVLEGDLAVSCIKFFNDGYSMYILWHNLDSIIQYELGSPYDITSINQVIKAPNWVLGSDSRWFDIVDNGSTLLVLEYNSKTIQKWDITTAYDISTIANENENYYNFSDIDLVKPYRFIFFNEGNKLFIYDDDTTYIYSTDIAYKFNSLSLIKSFNNRLFDINEDEGFIYFKNVIGSIFYQHYFDFNTLTLGDLVINVAPANSLQFKGLFGSGKYMFAQVSTNNTMLARLELTLPTILGRINDISEEMATVTYVDNAISLIPTFPAPYLEELIPDSYLPDTTGNFILKGSYFTEQMCLPENLNNVNGILIEEQTINYATFISSREIHVNALSGSNEGGFSVTLNNGSQTVVFKNSLLIVLGNVRNYTAVDWFSVPSNVLVVDDSVYNLEASNGKYLKSKIELDYTKSWEMRFCYEVTPYYGDLPANSLQWTSTALLFQSFFKKVSDDSVVLNHYIGIGNDVILYVNGFQLNANHLADNDLLWENRYVIAIRYNHLTGEISLYVNQVKVKSHTIPLLTENLYFEINTMRLLDILDIKYIELAT